MYVCRLIKLALNFEISIEAKGSNFQGLSWLSNNRQFLLEYLWLKTVKKYYSFFFFLIVPLRRPEVKILLDRLLFANWAEPANLSELSIHLALKVVYQCEYTIENYTNSMFCYIKRSKICVIFFNLNFTWLCGSWHYVSTKEFWKNSHFENMRAVFLLIYGSKSCLLGVLWYPKVIKIQTTFGVNNNS